MTRTLADMTPAERQACVGMWVKVTPAGGNSPSRTPFLGVLASLDANAYWGKGGYVVRGPHTCAFYFAEMELQPDLPRAWTPDGEPVPGEWADGHMWWGEDADTMQTVDLVGAECLTTGQVQGFEEWPEGVTPGEDVPVRRYITDWEEA